MSRLRLNGRFVRKAYLNTTKTCFKNEIEEEDTVNCPDSSIQISTRDESVREDALSDRDSLSETSDSDDPYVDEDENTLSDFIEAVDDDGSVLANIEGSRIIDLNFFAKKLYCLACGGPLHISNILRERLYGLASLFDIVCLSCQHVSKVATSKRHCGPTGPFDINSRSSIGKFHIQNWL